MKISQAAAPLSRRSALKLSAGITGSLMASGPFIQKLAAAESSSSSSTTPSKEDQDTLQDILQAGGSASDGVFSIEIDRDDISDVMLHGVTILPSFQINGMLDFQRVSGGKLLLNGDMALKPSELNPFIKELIRNGITFQAEHQHFYDFDPMVWYVHYRAVGSAEWLAKAMKAALDVTETPFPQSMPSNPKTPLPADEIGKILGATPQVGPDGVVTYEVPRRESIVLGGYRINPYLNVASTIAFQPYHGGKYAAVIPDFALIGSEVNKVIGYLLANAWDVGCLYNQETDENPQLYFSHNFKLGDAVHLAHQVRMALNMTNSKFES